MATYGDGLKKEQLALAVEDAHYKRLIEVL